MMKEGKLASYLKLRSRAAMHSNQSKGIRSHTCIMQSEQNEIGMLILNISNPPRAGLDE
jgi:hypothetical protein